MNITVGLNWILTLGCTFLVLVGTAQPEGNLIQGFVVTNKGDTLHGLIQVEKPILQQLRVKFYPTKNDVVDFKFKIYKPEDLQGFAIKTEVNNNSEQRIEKWVSYHRKEAQIPPIPFKGTVVFMELKETGLMNLYFYISKMGEHLEEGYFYYLESDKLGEPVVLSKENFDHEVEAIFKTCPKIIDRIGRGDFNFANFPKIVWTYNRCNMEATPASPVGEKGW